MVEHFTLKSFSMLIDHDRYSTHRICYSPLFPVPSLYYIGWKLVYSCCFFADFSPFLNIGMMIVSFHFVENLDMWRDLLKIATSDRAVWCAVSLSNRLLTLSAPIDFEVLSCRCILSTSCVDQVWEVLQDYHNLE